MLFCVACGNAAFRAIMRAQGGGMTYVSGKSEGASQEKGNVAGGARRKAACGAADDFEMGERSFP